MTDDTTTTPRSPIEDIANTAATDPSKLAPAQITRLGDWILDHEAHIEAHQRLVARIGTAGANTAERNAGQRRPAPTGDLTERLALANPAPSTADTATTHMEPLPEAQTTEPAT